MNKITRKQQSDSFSRILIFFIASLSILILFIMATFIIKEAVPAYKEYGFFHMYFTSDFTSKGGFGIWSALLITIFTSIASVAIALPLSLRTAIFIRFRAKKSRKYLFSFISMLAGIPSVVFGIFAIQSLNHFSRIFTHSDNPMTLFNSIAMLTIMIFPTMTTLIYNQLKLVDETLIHSSIAMGTSKTSAIYKVVKKSIRSGVHVAIIASLGRAIGETMALSMILVNPSNSLHGAFGDILNSSFATLGVEISRNMFNDSSNELSKSALFAAGIALFVMVMIMIAIITKMTNKSLHKSKNPLNYKKLFFNKEYQYDWFRYIVITLHTVLLPFKLISYYFSIFINKLHLAFDLFASVLLIPYWRLIYPKRKSNQTQQKYLINNSRLLRTNFDDYWKVVLEVISMIFVIGSSLWIVTDILTKGIPSWTANDWKFSHSNSIGKSIGGEIMNPLIWTIILIEITIIIVFPLALMTALYLSEYARNKRSGKIIRFFLDSLGGTPSILFGIFGTIFFLEYLNLRQAAGATSLIAGSLTMVLVVLPTFTRVIEQVLVRVPDRLRNASYALGASRIETIYKVVLPQAVPGIMSGVILSIGRIISETAPIYLTLGMMSNTSIGLLEGGHTLTTDILQNQIFSSLTVDNALSQSYKLASVAVILVALITLTTNLLNSKSKENNRKVKIKYAKKYI